MIWITGDTHGDFQRLHGFDGNPHGPNIGPNDTLLICGDFGGVWAKTPAQEKNLDALAALPYDICFVDGNHENFDLLEKFPEKNWNGGKVHEIRPNLRHLCRGEIFKIEGLTFFAMGGAKSHNISDGILNPKDPDFRKQYEEMKRCGAEFRVNGVSWWKKEMPSAKERRQAEQSLARASWSVDYVVTHCAPQSIASIICPYPNPKADTLTTFFDDIQASLRFRRWYFGHYHQDKAIGEKFQCLYKRSMLIPI